MNYLSKLFFLVLINFFYSPISLITQWELVKRYDWGTDIRGLQSFNNNKCIVLGSIYDNLVTFIDQTKDGGLSWSRIYSDSSYMKNKVTYLPTRLYSVSYADSNLIIAVGDSGLILRSPDDGLSWQKIQLDKNKMLLKILMKDRNNGMILNGLYDRFYAELHKTKDGGLTWEKLTIPKELKWLGYFDLQVINDTTFYLNVQPEDEEPCIIHVINDFKKYEKYFYSKNPNHKYNYESMSFINPKKGWIAGGPDILKTIDGGISWVTTSFSGKFIRKINFVNDNYGIAIGRQFTSLITYDSGLTWHENDLKVDNKLVGMTDFDIADSSTVYFCTFENIFKYSGTLNSSGNKHKDPPVFEINEIIKLNEKIKIELNNDINDLTFSFNIYNIHGQELFKLTNQSTSIELFQKNCNILNRGFYFILINTNKQSFTFKILII